MVTRRSLEFVGLMDSQEDLENSVIFTPGQANDKELTNSEEDQTLANSNENTDYIDLDRTKNVGEVSKQLQALADSLSPIMTEFQGEMLRH